MPVVDAKGHLRHDGGVVDSPGLYALGLPVLRRRKSTFIHGIEDDAREVIDHLAALPGHPPRKAACATKAAWSKARACTRWACPVLRRRKSTFIHGIEDDAREVIDHLAHHLSTRRRS